jgi:ankyrin repeat protein
VNLLLTSGSSVNLQDGKNSTPLHRAAQSGHIDIVTLLLSSGAGVNIRNSNNKTAFDLAVDNDRLDVARSIAEWIGDTDLQVFINSVSLVSASQDSLPSVAMPPLGRGSEANIPDELRRSLHAASGAGHLEIVRSLLEGGANIDERDESHRTPLSHASGSGRVEVAKLLIEYGADVNSSDGTGWTPLHSASSHGHAGVVHLLLDHGADANAMKQDLWTALHHAIFNRSLEIVKALLEQGADVRMRNDLGHTPFQMASWMGLDEIVQFLSEYDAQGK